MALTTDELSQIKNHLGYGNLTVSARPYFDIAAVFETVVQNNVDAWGELYLRNTILPQLLAIDTDTVSARAIAGGDVVDETKRNPRHLAELREHREYWTGRLETTVKVPRAAPISSNSFVEQG